MKSVKNMLPTISSFTAEQIAEMEARSKAWDAEQERIKVRKRIKDGRIPKAFLHAKFEGEPPTSDLLLQGETGSGKTHYSCALLMELAKTKTIRFTTVEDLLRDIRSSFKGFESEAQVMAQYRNVGVLVLDDLGKEKITDWVLTTLYSILNYRLNAEKQTIISMQHATTELIQLLLGEKEGRDENDVKTVESIISRLSTFERIPFKHEDRRLP